MSAKLSHTSSAGRATMVDVGDKPESRRMATASGFISLQPSTIKLVRENLMKKGDVLGICETAGVMAAKKTAELIPLCHNLFLENVQVKAEVRKNGVQVTASSRCSGKTGVEMEALTAVSVALLTVYDMCKAVDKKMVIGDIKLVSKTKETL